MKKNKWVIKLLVLSLLMFNVACSGKDDHFVLPNQQILIGKNVYDYSKMFDVQYFQYEGFKAKYNDSLLKECIFIFKNHLEYVGSDVLDENQIEKLKNMQIVEIQFHISANKIMFENLLEYLKRKYLNTKLLENKTNLGFHVTNKCSFVSLKNGKTLCTVEFVKFVVPYYKISLKSI